MSKGGDDGRHQPAARDSTRESYRRRGACAGKATCTLTRPDPLRFSILDMTADRSSTS